MHKIRPVPALRTGAGLPHCNARTPGRFNNEISLYKDLTRLGLCRFDIPEHANFDIIRARRPCVPFGRISEVRL